MDVEVSANANGSPRVGAGGMLETTDTGTPKGKGARGLQRMISFTPWKASV